MPTSGVKAAAAAKAVRVSRIERGDEARGSFLRCNAPTDARSDTGIMTVLREAYKHINSLELQLVEIHKKMSADPALGILVYLANRDGTSVDERPIPPLNPLEEGNAWVELIARHKR